MHTHVDFLSSDQIMQMWLLAALLARVPTYKYFVMQDGYVETDVKQTVVQECFEFGKNVTSLFLDEFTGPNPVTLLHAWRRETEKGEYYACEVLRMKTKYLITVNIRDGNRYLHSVRILNEETESGTHWFKPTDDITELVMSELKKRFGEDLELENVAVYKTVMRMDTHGQFVVDCLKGDERMLIDVRLMKKFGAKEMTVEAVNRIY